MDEFPDPSWTAGALPGAAVAGVEPRPGRVLERSARPGWPDRVATHAAGPAPGAVPVPPGPAGMEAVVAPLVEAGFYLAANPDVAAAGMEPVRHYCRLGWREGRNPSPGFDTRHYLARYPDVVEQGLNPLWHFAAIGRAEGRSPAPAAPLPPGAEAALRQLFDRDFYSRSNPDVVADGADPFEHYLLFGRAEGRAPNPWFDPGFYRRCDQELAASGLDPVLHYAVRGRAEGRAARDASPELRAALGELRPAAGRREEAGFPASVSLLEACELARRLAPRLHGTRAPCTRLVVSLSHDAYTREVGGTQILIADEQARFAAQGAAYLHLAPVLPRLHLVAQDTPNPLRGTLDGEELGCFEMPALLAALAQLDDPPPAGARLEDPPADAHLVDAPADPPPVDAPPADAPPARLPADRLLVCHCLLGHEPAMVARLHATLAPGRAVFWVHDYSSLCEGYTLLRNDVAFCAAPPPDSLGCRICIHGATRARHLQAMAALFAAVPFDVVAPSEAALAVWRAGTALPHRSATAHPHAELLFTARRRSVVPQARHGTAAAPVRVAFVGHAALHKGWAGFVRVVEDCRHDPAYAFFHLGTPGAAAGLPVRGVDVRVTAGTRDAMRCALEEHAIELVLVLSPWPETFCFVAYEAMAAGADVVALRDGGNVAACVLQTGRGVVCDTMEAVRDFFTSGRAVHYVRLCLQGGNPAGTLRPLGATATLPLPAPDGDDDADAEAGDAHAHPHADTPGDAAP